MLGRDGKTTVAPAEMPKLAYRCRQIAEDYSDGRLLSRDWKGLDGILIHQYHRYSY